MESTKVHSGGESHLFDPFRVTVQTLKTFVNSEKEKHETANKVDLPLT